jgi:hypothetical protein
LENLQREPTVYLLLECENEEEVRECLEEVCGQIFEKQFDGWYRVPLSWPIQRDLANFDHWFEWSFHSVVFDLCDDPLLHEEIWLLLRLLPDWLSPIPVFGRYDVERAKLGDAWPLAVEDGQLDCKIIRAGGYSLQAITITHDGVIYALNGVAESHLKARDIRPIWAAPPAQWITLKSGERVNAAPPKINIGKLQDAAKELCK